MVTLVNRVKQNITSTGTGLNVTLGTAVAGYQTLSDAGVALSEQVHYVIEDGDAWEYGVGTLFFTNTNFYRAQQKSSDGTSRIDLSGSAVMFVSPLAEDISNSYIEKTANYTAKAGEKILANTSGGAWTLTLPSSAVGGTRIVVADHDDWSTNNLTVARNGNNIEGDAEDMILDIGGALVEFVWDGANWQVYAQAGVEGGNAEYEKVGTISSSTLDLETGNVFSHAPSANVTYVFSNPPASGTAYGFTLKVTPSATVTVTWPSSVDWAGGAAPDAPASGETDVYVFYTQDGGTTYYGFQAGDAMA